MAPWAEWYFGNHPDVSIGESAMRKAGGLIALIAGVFAVIAAIVTLFVGGIGGALDAEGADTVIGLGWGGLGFAFLTIILGAVGMNSRSRIPGILLIVSSLAGAILGGTIVAIFMGLAAVAGLVSVIGKAAPKPQLPAQGTEG